MFSLPAATQSSFQAASEAGKSCGFPLASPTRLGLGSALKAAQGRVAQPDRASVSEAEGRRFDSCHAHQQQSPKPHAEMRSFGLCRFYGGESQACGWGSRIQRCGSRVPGVRISGLRMRIWGLQTRNPWPTAANSSPGTQILGRAIRLAVPRMRIPTLRMRIPGLRPRIHHPRQRISSPGNKSRVHGCRILGLRPRIHHPRLRITSPGIQTPGPRMRLPGRRMRISGRGFNSRAALRVLRSAEIASPGCAFQIHECESRGS